MKVLIFLFFLATSVFANELENKQTSEEFTKHSDEKQLSKQEQTYQKYLKEKEEENRKLEEDGFCFCNND